LDTYNTNNNTKGHPHPENSPSFCLYAPLVQISPIRDGLQQFCPFNIVVVEMLLLGKDVSTVQLIARKTLLNQV